MITSPITAEGGGGTVAPAGPQGPSAYDVAVQNGFAGSQTQWLASLQGQTADPTALNAAVSRASVQADNAQASASTASQAASTSTGILATITTKISDAITAAVTTLTTTLNAAVTSASNYATGAGQSATAAAGSATAASGSATSATTQASAASTSASASAGSATSAAGSATAAAGSATTAQKWAMQTSGTVDGTNYSAKYYAQQAATSAAAAAGGGAIPSGTFTAGHILVANNAQGTTFVDGGAPGNAAFKNTGTTSGTVAAGDDSRITGAASAASVNSVLGDVAINTQNLLYTGLLIAALRGVPTGIVDGILDPFSSTADINTGASSGYTFSASLGTIGATPGSYGAPYTTVSGTAITDGATSGGPAASAFDGNASSYWQSSSNAVGVSYIGLDFGAGKASVINQIAVTQYSNGSYDTTSVLVQYADSPSGPWTTAVTANPTSTIAVPGTAAHRCWRLLLNAATNGGSQWTVNEIVMQTGTASAPAAMVLQSATLASAVASPSAMRALIQVDSTSAVPTPNTDLIVSLSRDGGTTFTQGTLALIQTMPDGTSIYDTGWLSVTGQPTGNSTMTYKVTTPTAKAIVLTGVSMQVKP